MISKDDKVSAAAAAAAAAAKVAVAGSPSDFSTSTHVSASLSSVSGSSEQSVCNRKSPSPPSSNKSARKKLTPSAVAIAAICMFIVHFIVQYQYYAYCRSNLLQIMLFQQSAMCTHMGHFVNLVELAYRRMFTHLAGRIIALCRSAYHGENFVSSTCFGIVIGILDGVVAKLMTPN